MSLKDDPSILVIPPFIRFPATDYSTKRLLARNWVRKRHPDGPVRVYEVVPRLPINHDRDRSGLPKDWLIVAAKRK